jgi:hypothetical protein
MMQVKRSAEIDKSTKVHTGLIPPRQESIGQENLLERGR